MDGVAGMYKTAAYLMDIAGWRRPPMEGAVSAEDDDKSPKTIPLSRLEISLSWT